MTRLLYKPEHNSVTSTSQYLVISEHDSTILHVHAWSTEHLGSIDLSQHGVEQKYIYHVRVGDGDVLYVATGAPSGTGASFMIAVTHLHTFQVIRGEL